MLISVCIPAMRPTTVVDAVASILRQTWTDWELIVVGQGQDADLQPRVEQVAGMDGRVRYMHLPRRGLSRARNAAIALSRGEVIAMTDDDCEASSDWLAVLANCFAEAPEVGLVGGALLAPEMAGRARATCPALSPADAVYDPRAMGRRAPPGWDWIGGNFAVRRDVLERAGAFDEYLGAGALFPSGEDTDYKLRLEALGVIMRSTPRAVVHHTYGARYGVGAGLRHSRNYARGNGALAAKLTLQGDVRGEEWLRMATRESSLDWLRDKTPHRLPVSLLRLRHFRHAYHECLARFRVDPAQMTLQPLDAALSEDRQGDLSVWA